jgi:hypothetical protein
MGAHVVQVARPGHVPRLERITLVPSAPSRTLTVALEPGVEWVPAPSAAATRGAVDVQSRPRGARVIVDGRFVGQAPLRVVDLRPGLHRVGLELGGYHSIDTQFRVDAGRSAPLRVTLQSVQ